jgi:hypothetical protein
MFRRFDRPEIKSATLECVEDGPFSETWNNPAGQSRTVWSKTKSSKKKKGGKKKL